MSTYRNAENYYVDRFTTFDVEICAATTLQEALEKTAIKLTKISRECNQRIYNISQHVEYEGHIYYVYTTYGLSIVHRERKYNGTQTNDDRTKRSNGTSNIDDS